MVKTSEETGNVGGVHPMKVFVDFQYPEIKDLSKHFITLISAALVLSVSFSDKVVEVEAARPVQQWMMISAWVLLVLALGACGIGILLIYMAAERSAFILHSDRKSTTESARRVRALMRRSYFFICAAGCQYGFALALLVSAAIFRYLPT